ncbi:hypothetical protein FI667_g13607, partial [Globisporangium splendens]
MTDNDAATNDLVTSLRLSSFRILTTGGAVAHASGNGAQRAVRGRYAKFNGGMDVLLLEAMRHNNPFTAKHGTRLQMWQNIAEIVGEELFKNPEAYSWHTCRDRVTALMKMYADGKHDKLFKHGTEEENSRKEAILRELNLSIARKSKVTIRPAASLLDSSAAMAAASTTTRSRGAHAAALGSSTGALHKRRRLDVGAGSGTAAKLDATTGVIGIGGVAHLDSETFRARVLTLIESKVQFDMEQRMKETELREQEFELQKRFLEYLQSK